MAEDPAADRRALVEVINLGLLWHCLCAITRLEVPERLAAGPLPLAELAPATGADPDALGRVLRLVADHQIVTLEQDRVGLTDRGRLLCRDHPASLSAAFATVGDSDVAHGLTETLQTGRAAAPRVLGMGYWDYLAAHPDQQALFDQSMVQRAQLLSLACRRAGRTGRGGRTRGARRGPGCRSRPAGRGRPPRPAAPAVRDRARPPGSRSDQGRSPPGTPRAGRCASAAG
jgi:hypothetical protein